MDGWMEVTAVGVLKALGRTWYQSVNLFDLVMQLKNPKLKNWMQYHWPKNKNSAINKDRGTSKRRQRWSGFGSSHMPNLSSGAASIQHRVAERAAARLCHDTKAEKLKNWNVWWFLQSSFFKAPSLGYDACGMQHAACMLTDVVKNILVHSAVVALTLIQKVHLV